MPDPDLVCQVYAAGGIFSNWLTVAVSYTCDDTEPLRHFALSCAEPSAAKAALKLVPGDRVNIDLAGRRVIENGFIKIRQVGYDANRHGVQITGLSAAGNIQQASADPGQYRGYAFDAIARKVAQKYGVSFRMVNPPDGANLPFPNVIPSHGETDWHFLRRLARARGIILTAAANGDLVGGVPDGGSGATLEEGRNILSCNCYIEQPWMDKLLGVAQTPGSDGMSGRTAAEVASTAQINGGPGSGLTARVLADQPLNPQENKIATDAYAQQILLDTLRCTVTHHGWFKPGTTDLWELGDKVTVRSPMAFGRVDTQQLRVWSVTCSQTPEGQTTTSVQLVSEPVFQRKYPDGQAGDPFGQSAKAASIQMPA
ncbi:hypothetical protein [Methylobacterium gnaphalii]|uniref:Baseplate hub protein gp44/GpP-like second domain-containing protein n=1 Tax=Methylobacterium gnaphalii TaxID=1010610 RepID=A0A512JF73_9HYPH|nr:hypothetical protein [Methylobacterium gnaphalii]GEP08586.1 hypothetical protein MGN01_04310 [Methylobacterium gnaphalii]GJD70579.1 hypothetical protein MMMDOFMJ_3528 [Methylobacterium gnaphalii]GLS50803.1 hypothetical protein GCM10007885_36570 [Methylobacterium gnaphalii]